VFAPFRPSSSIEDLQHESLRMLVTINVKMLIIDEIHHVLAAPLLKQRHFLNVIKYMGNELQIPLVAAGTHDAFNAIISRVGRGDSVPLSSVTHGRGSRACSEIGAAAYGVRSVRVPQEVRRHERLDASRARRAPHANPCVPSRHWEQAFVA
jgi:hypothetical protein